MSEHRAKVEWKLDGEFDYLTYPRRHVMDFGQGITMPGTAAPENIPKTVPAAAGVDPEQAFVASLSSCHMLWFLHLACAAKLTVTRYLDDASGVLGKNANGAMAMTRITLRPAVSFAGTPPGADEHARLHREAHEKCFIANSVKSEVVCEPRVA